MLLQRLQARTRTARFESSGDVTRDHDVTFWFGDLNYRINGNIPAVQVRLRAAAQPCLHRIGLVICVECWHFLQIRPCRGCHLQFTFS